MARRKHFVILGRTSQAIAQAIIDQFGDGGKTADGPVINHPGAVIQARFGTHNDGEPTANLFVDGKLPDHPTRQNLSRADKKDIAGALEDANVTIVHSMSGANASSRMQSMLFMAAYLKQQLNVNKIKLVATYMAGMRSDRSFINLDGNPEYNAISCGLYAQQLHFAGVRKVAGIEAHSRSGVKLFNEVFGEGNVDFTNTGAFMARSLRSEFEHVVVNNQPAVIVGSPDGMNKAKDYGIARASSFASALYEGTNWADDPRKDDLKKRRTMFGIHKERKGPGETEVVDFCGTVEGRDCWLIDDMISSGGTTLKAAKALQERGATRIFALATHGVLPGEALPKLLGSPLIDGVHLTDTVPGIMEKIERDGINGHSKLKVVTVAPLVCAAIAKDFPRNNPLPFAKPQAG